MTAKGSTKHIAMTVEIGFSTSMYSTYTFNLRYAKRANFACTLHLALRSFAQSEVPITACEKVCDKRRLSLTTHYWIGTIKHIIERDRKKFIESESSSESALRYLLFCGINSYNSLQFVLSFFLSINLIVFQNSSHSKPSFPCNPCSRGTFLYHFPFKLTSISYAH